jgi:hypothetical protein
LAEVPYSINNLLLNPKIIEVVAKRWKIAKICLENEFYFKENATLYQQQDYTSNT